MVESSKIKRIREKLGLSQEKLARLADVSNNTIINIEAGKQQNPTVDTLKKIAKALNVPIEDCFGNISHLVILRVSFRQNTLAIFLCILRH